MGPLCRGLRGQRVAELIRVVLLRRTLALLWQERDNVRGGRFGLELRRGSVGDVPLGKGDDVRCRFGRARLNGGYRRGSLRSGGRWRFLLRNNARRGRLLSAPKGTSYQLGRCTCRPVDDRVRD